MAIEMNEDGTPKEGKPAEPTAAELAAKKAAEEAAAAAAKPDATPAPELTDADLDLNAPAPEAEVTFEPTGNAALDSVGKLLASKKIDPAILTEFTKTGEFSLDDKAALIEGLGEATANLVFDKLNTEVANVREANKKARTETLEYAASVFEGAKADTVWGQIQAYVRNPENGFEVEEKTQLSAMLKKGGLQAKMALDHIAKKYYSNPNTTSRADLIAGDTYVTGSFEPLTAKAYASEVRAAIQKHGEQSPQVQDLRRRRELSRNQGIR